MENKVRVAILVPSLDTWKASFGLALIELTRWMNAYPTGFDPEIDPDEEEEVRTDIEFAVLNYRTSILPNGRTKLVEGGLGLGADWLLFLDSDMTFPADIFHRLYKHQKDVVATVYPKRNGKEAVIDYRGSFELKGLKPVDRIATGCTLMKAEVFTKIQKPWFEFHMAREGDPFEVIGEDIYLSNKLNAAKVEMYVDFDASLDIGHIGEQAYRIKFAEAK